MDLLFKSNKTIIHIVEYEINSDCRAGPADREG